MGKKVTIKDIKRGMLICNPECVYPHNEVKEIIDIKYNPRAGEPVKDMWGGTVWDEPFAEIIAVGKITGERTGYSVQTEDSDLSSWITFIKSPEERIEKIYQDRRYWAKYHLQRVFQDRDFRRYIEDVKKYPAQLGEDKEMRELIKLVDNIAKIL